MKKAKDWKNIYMISQKQIIKNWNKQIRFHKFFLSLVIILGLIIIACSYALFDGEFNKWISGNGAFFLPFLITLELLIVSIWLWFYFVTLKSVKFVLTKAYNSNRIRKKDYEKLLGILEEAIANQDEYETKIMKEMLEILRENKRKDLEIYKKALETKDENKH